ncbi:MAG: hypothetical protein ACLT98_06955 [Eggerthellaceae bacterium]
MLIEPTSGNTGTLAAIAAARGMRLIIAMPGRCPSSAATHGSPRCRAVLTDGALGMKGAIARAEELAAEIPNCSSWAHEPGEWLSTKLLRVPRSGRLRAATWSVGRAAR